MVVQRYGPLEACNCFWWYLFFGNPRFLCKDLIFLLWFESITLFGQFWVMVSGGVMAIEEPFLCINPLWREIVSTRWGEIEMIPNTEAENGPTGRRRSFCCYIPLVVTPSLPWAENPPPPPPLLSEPLTLFATGNALTNSQVSLRLSLQSGSGKVSTKGSSFFVL